METMIWKGGERGKKEEELNGYHEVPVPAPIPEQWPSRPGSAFSSYLCLCRKSPNDPGQLPPRPGR